MAAAFAVAVAVFLAVRAAPPAAPYVKTLWSWIPVGDLSVSAALQVDQLSVVMLLVVTGVSSLIHLFSVGYMHDDPGLRALLRVHEPVRGVHARAGPRAPASR